MIAFFWLAALAGSLAVTTGLKLGWLEPTSYVYAGTLVGCGVLWGFAAGSGSGRISALISGPIWSGVAVGVLTGGVLVAGAGALAGWLLPPIYYPVDMSLWERLSPGWVVTILSAAAALVSYPVTFAFWRWWGD